MEGFDGGDGVVEAVVDLLEDDDCVCEGKVNHWDGGGGGASEIGGWIKNGGMEVMPESERPFTPILDSSNSFTALARSYSFFAISIMSACLCVIVFI